MTGSSVTLTASPPAGSIVSSLDRLVGAMRRWIEDRLPWYDRGEEERKLRRSERIHERSINARIRAEAVQAQYRIGHR